MKTNSDYKPILASLKTLKESGRVDITWHGMGGYASSEFGGEKPQVWLNKRSCKIVLYIHKDDTLESLGEKVIKAEELMDELEIQIAYRQQNPDMYEFLYANLEL